jgi:hypothetical protein
MTRGKLGVLLLAATAIAASLVFPGTASADPAIVIHKDSGLCGMPGSDANGNIIFGGIGAIWHVVENDNKVTLVCKGESITNLSGKGQHYEGFACGLVIPSDGFVLTTDSFATVARNGNATLSCTFDKP